METRVLGRTGRDVSTVGLGCWQLGGDWGTVGEDEARAVVHAALDAGVTFLDTADVYGDGRSERILGAVLAERAHPAEVVVATKAGRRADPHVADAYTAHALRAWVERSREHLGVDTVDLLQLHCPPPQVLHRDAVFDALDGLVDDRLVAAYGVSVETRSEALAAIARPGVASIQIIVNLFRMQPVAEVLPAAADAGVGVVVRVPLASGLLSGRYTRDTRFAADDHRTYNRDGSAFDVGETFAGVPFEVGVAAAREVAALVPDGMTPAQLALRWVLDQPGVTTVIPGARDTGQVLGNAAVGAMEPLPDDLTAALAAVYEQRVRTHVHDRW